MAYRQFSTIMTMWNSHALQSNAILAKSFYKCMSSSASAGKSLNVGFVGLGNMGARMANNLIKKVNAIDKNRLLNATIMQIWFNIQLENNFRVDDSPILIAIIKIFTVICEIFGTKIERKNKNNYQHSHVWNYSALNKTEKWEKNAHISFPWPIEQTLCLCRKDVC